MQTACCVTTAELPRVSYTCQPATLSGAPFVEDKRWVVTVITKMPTTHSRMQSSQATSGRGFAAPLVAQDVWQAERWSNT